FPNPSAALLRRGLFLYVLGQQLHFAVWLRLFPDVERERAVPPAFRRAFERLRAELGGFTWPAVVLAVGGALAVFLGQGLGREAYFALTYFHLGLEAAVLCRVAARGGAAS